ncbi:MAG: hypothetical protein P1U53_16095 [Sulfitobacter sp.]|nr:hypothetical protein [Sulfitobacter sp.]
MQDNFRRIANAFGIGFALMICLAFLPGLFLIPAVFSTGIEGGGEGIALLWVVAIFATVPFGGYISLVIFGQPGDRFHNFLSLTSLWGGILAGSVVGTRMAA